MDRKPTVGLVDEVELCAPLGDVRAAVQLHENWGLSPAPRSRSFAMTTADDSPVPNYPDLLRLENRGFVVVGAGQGNGRQTAHALASVGARVLCVDIDGGRADEVAAEVGGIACVADATRSADVERLIDEAKQELGRIHGVCDIVGMARWAALVDMPEEDWDWNFNIVLRHAFLLIKHAAPVMATDGGGSLAFVASISGVSSAPYHGGYGAAKAGLLSLVRTAAVELAGASVRVNAVVPGGIATPRLAKARGTTLEDATDGGLRSPARTSDIASALLFLSSDLAHHITGHALAVDGGDLVQYPLPMPGPLLDPGQAMGDVADDTAPVPTQ
jgi:NAD(P)-dependent dehydrogenase (short-subunit alcohol dehydrogenase family)